MRFTDRTALVIGGNSGIGLAAARALAAEGAAVFITGRDPATLSAAEADVPGLRACQADVADPDSLAPVLDRIRAEHGRLDHLFVNAGVGHFQPVREVTAEAWDNTHAINLRGCFFAVQRALPLMGRGGSILFTGSIGATAAVPGNVAYAASKAGLRAVARILAKELVEEGIRVNILSPGPVETPIINRSGLDEAGIAHARAAMMAAVPMGRLGDPDEVARAMLFLASDDASFITGIDLAVDGGALEL